MELRETKVFLFTFNSWYNGTDCCHLMYGWVYVPVYYFSGCIFFLRIFYLPLLLRARYPYFMLTLLPHPLIMYCHLSHKQDVFVHYDYENACMVFYYYYHYYYSALGSVVTRTPAFRICLHQQVGRQSSRVYCRRRHIRQAVIHQASGMLVSWTSLLSYNYVLVGCLIVIAWNNVAVNE